MGYIYTVGVELLFQFLHSSHQLIYLLLTALPGVLFRQQLVDIHILPHLLAYYSHCFIEFILHILVFQPHLHHLLLGLLKLRP